MVGLVARAQAELREFQTRRGHDPEVVCLHPRTWGRYCKELSEAGVPFEKDTLLGYPVELTAHIDPRAVVFGGLSPAFADDAP